MRKLSTWCQPAAIFFNILFLGLSLRSYPQSGPEITDIPDQVIDEGKSFTAIILDEVVNDPDNSPDELSWTVSSNDDLQVVIQDRVAMIETPDIDWFGEETILFTVTDPDSNLSSDEATFTVIPVNDAPVISDIPDITITEGSSFSDFNLDAYVTDIDDALASLTWSVSEGMNLTAVIDDSHNASVTSENENWTGSESFVFTVKDALGDEDSDNATFTITNTDDLPLAADDYFEVTEGGNFSTPSPGVLSNDSDADGDPLSAELVSSPSGSTSFNLYEDGAVMYLHDGSPATEDFFTYVAKDGTGESNIATAKITIEPVNDDPVISGLAGQTVNEGTDFEPIQLDQFVSDEEDQDNLLAWESSGYSELTVAIDDGTHIATIRKPHKKWTGSETITFTVTDTQEGTDSETATFISDEIAEAPVAEPDNYEVKEGGELIIPAPGVLENDEDGDGDPLTAQLLSKPSNKADFVFNTDGSFTYTHNGSEAPIIDVFTYRAYDGNEYSEPVTVTISITPANDPPVVSDIPNQTYIEGQSFETIALDNFVSDPDNTDNQITWTFSGNSQLTVNINASRVATIGIPNSDWYGSETITFIATDPSNDSDSDPVTFTLTNLNDPPVVSDIPDQTILEGGSFATITLDNHVSDPDDADDQITWTFSGNSQLSVTISPTRVATIGIPNSDWFGSETITFIATDPSNDSDSDPVTFTVTNLNDPPVVSDIPDQTIDEGGSFATIALDNYVSDPDNTDNQITWTFNGNSQLSVTISPTRVATIGIPNSDWFGSETITFVAADPSNDSDSDPVTFTVTNLNDPPVVSDIPDQTIDEGGSFATIALDNYVSDPDDADGQITWTFSGNSQLTVNINASRVATIGIPNSDWYGSETITFIATDQTGASDSDPVTFTVTNLNDPPVVSDIPNQTILEGTAFTTIALDSYVTDADHTDEEISWTYSGNVDLVVSIVNRIATITVPSKDWNGSETIIFTATDPLNAFHSNDAKFEVTDSPDAFITGSGTFCPGTTIPINLIIAGGTPPYEAILHRTGDPGDIIISSINLSPWIIYVNNPGTYNLIKVTDVEGVEADVEDSEPVILSHRFSPLATISSAIDSICPGETAQLTVTLTSGSKPWGFTYVRNGLEPKTITGIQGNTYTLTVSQEGTYTINSVTDPDGTGCGSGTAIISSHIPPTGIISGNSAICEHTTANINISLTGKSPWKFSYHRNFLLDSTVIQNVKSSPRQIQVKNGGTYRLYEVVDRNGCVGTISGSAVVTVTPAPDVTISGLKAAYNFEFNEIDTIIGTPQGGDYAGPGVLGNFFLPRIAGLGTHSITYRYRSSPLSCWGYDTAIVNVLESNAVILFENKRTKYCENDAPFTVTGINLTGAVGIFTISGGAGIVDNGNNTATIRPKDLNPNKYVITYSYQQGDEYFFEKAEFDIGPPPTAMFNWATECYHEGQPIDIKNTSTSSFGFLTDSSYLWKINTVTGFDSDTLKNITYTFPKAGIYKIDLYIKNSYGCSDTATRYFNLRKTYDLKDRYFESFELHPTDWQINGTTSANSWTLGNPSKHDNPPRGFSGAYRDTACWYTKITKIPAPIENSWVTSPCFDFSNSDRPMLTMQVWRLFNANRDGANIQVSADSGKTWNLVGEIGDGENWFNTSNIRGEPGGKDDGWSNYDGASNDAFWGRARHGLDFLKGKKDVQFRIAYGSDGTPQNNDGIAFDDFTISERTKMTLIEHFTNTALDEAGKADSIIDLFADQFGMHAIDIQYHTSSPPGDPLYEDNPLIPTNRQFYYGLFDVPYSVIDGGAFNKHSIDYIVDSRPFDKNVIIRQSLTDSKFQIDVVATREGNIINSRIHLIANEVLPLLELSVRSAVVESLIEGISGANGDTSFRNVVRTMLPDAAGVTLYKSWGLIEDMEIVDSWQIENVNDINRLMVVAFIQNEATREIFNVAVDTVEISTASVDPLPVPAKKPSFSLYPNPAKQHTTVLLNAPADSDIVLQLFSNTGTLVYSSRIRKGDTMINIPVEAFPDGLYMLRLLTQNKLIGIRKLVVIN